MDLTKKLELELNDLETIEASIMLMNEVVSNNTKQVENLRKAMAYLTDKEKQIIQRTCIDKVSPKYLDKELNHTVRTIYLYKKKALEHLSKLMYGGVENES